MGKVQRSRVLERARVKKPPRKLYAFRLDKELMDRLESDKPDDLTLTSLLEAIIEEYLST